MRVSRFEIYRVCQRVIEGAGAPDGVDDDAGHDVAWLETRGLPGLACLARDMKPEPAASGVVNRDGAALDMNGASAVFAAGNLVDFAVASALGLAGQAATIAVRRCASPIFLLPAAARHAHDGCTLRIAWPGAAGEIACLADRAGVRIACHGDTPDPRALLAGDGAPAEVTIEACAKGGVAAVPDGLTVCISSDELARRADDALASGVEVDDGVWQALKTLARKVLVPNSEHSRLRGAGAEVDDSA
jgi:hypothetical protein